jgi:hypothetical protein
MERRKFTREFKLPPGLSRLQRERMEKKMRKGMLRAADEAAN